MSAHLRSYDDDLCDLAASRPPLFDAQSGNFTGVTLTRWLGAGGMAAVILGDVDLRNRSQELSPLCPPRIAIKFAKPSIERDLARLNLSAEDLFRKEVTALGRVMERRPPTEFVLGIFGHGSALVEIAPNTTRALPWMALEFVDAGAAGATLTDRIRRCPDGIDPARATKLLRGIFEGVRVLHSERVIHRDLKPDNIFVAGPIDDETPKVADCGIARVGGVGMGTVAAVTYEYSAPEQVLSVFNPSASNPLIGPWTDLHALAAVVWYLLGGEDWCASANDASWHMGRRRSLKLAPRLHEGFRTAGALLDRLDEVIQRAAAHRLPDEAWLTQGASSYENIARARYGTSMFSGAIRYASIDAFATELFPALDEITRRWTAQAIRQNVQPTVFRKTQVLRRSASQDSEPFAKIRDLAPRTIAGTEMQLADPGFPQVEPGNVVFQPDGKILARFGDRLLYFVGDKAHRVPVPAPHNEKIASCRWLVRGPQGGFALVCPEQIILLKGGQFTSMPLPDQGPIVAAIGDGRVFGVVTTSDDDEPLFWRSTDGATWAEALTLPLTGELNAISFGPFGYLFVGGHTSKRGTSARAVLMGLDDQASVPTAGLKESPPLVVAVTSATRDAWAAGQGCVLRFDRAGVTKEQASFDEQPLAMALDPVGAPWLLTATKILRRHEGTPESVWETYYERSAEHPAFVAIGFTPEGARVLDARGGGIHVEPRDLDSWRNADTNMLVR